MPLVIFEVGDDEGRAFRYIPHAVIACYGNPMSQLTHDLVNLEVRGEEAEL